MNDLFGNPDPPPAAADLFGAPAAPPPVAVVRQPVVAAPPVAKAITLPSYPNARSATWARPVPDGALSRSVARLRELVPHYDAAVMAGSPADALRLAAAMSAVVRAANGGGSFGISAPTGTVARLQPYLEAPDGAEMLWGQVGCVRVKCDDGKVALSARLDWMRFYVLEVVESAPVVNQAVSRPSGWNLPAPVYGITLSAAVAALFRNVGGGQPTVTA